MSLEQILNRADEILMKRTGVSIYCCPGFDESEIREDWECNGTDIPEDIEYQALELADNLTRHIYDEWVDEFLLSKIGFRLEDFPNPNDESITDLVPGDLDWDNLDQYKPENFKEDAENVADMWIAAVWDDETNSFKT